MFGDYAKAFAMTDVATDRPLALLFGMPYYQGAPCKAGHSGVRYTGNRACVDCTANYGKARRADPVAIETERARRKAWAAANPDKMAQTRARYRQAHAAQIAQYRATDPHGAAARRAAKRKAETAARQQVRRAEREAAKRAKQEARKAAQIAKREARARERGGWTKAFARKARERNATGATTAAQLQLILAAQGWQCSYCTEAEGLEADHVHPLSKGGTNWPWNYQWLCFAHNRTKAAKPDHIYRQAVGIEPGHPVSRLLWAAALGWSPEHGLLQR